MVVAFVAVVHLQLQLLLLLVQYKGDFLFLLQLTFYCSFTCGPCLCVSGLIFNLPIDPDVPVKLIIILLPITMFV